MKIEILGMGCAKCKKLYENVKQAVAELNLTADIIKVEDIQKIMSYHVMSTPALAIDGKVKSSGVLLSAQQIKKLLEAN